MGRPTSRLSDNLDENWKTPYLEVISVGVIQFLLSLQILCYGVFIMQFILEDLYNLKTGLWTAIIFASVSKITNSWTRSYCKHLDNIRHKVHKRNMIVATLFLFTELVTSSFINTKTTQIGLFGLCGGLLSSIIYVHCKYATAQAFENRPKLFDMIDQLVKAFSLIFMPHFVLFMSNLYETKACLLILGALILNIIPASLLIKKTRHKKSPLCKFKTLERLSIEMEDLNHKTPVITEPSSSSSSSSDEDEEKEEVHEVTTEATLNNNIQKYFQNVGVKILPNIPEENELEEEEDLNEISSKRLSKISAFLQELNENNRKSVNLSVINLFQPDEIAESVEQEVELSEPSPKKSRCFSITSSALFELEAKKSHLKSFFHEYFIKPVPRTLRSVYFYPVVLSNVITTLLATVVFATAPYMMCLKNGHGSDTEATFILTIIGFSWLFFLAGHPVFSKLSPLKNQILFLIGLSVSGFSLFIVHKFSYDNFTLFSLTFGLGHGIVTYTETKTYESFSGQTNWKKLKGVLEICTGFFVILVYLIIYLCNLEIDVFLSFAYWLYVFNVSLWIVAYISKRIVFNIKHVRSYNCQRYSDFNF
ncbi:uncharacterized protein LOC664136 [Tribolium castaneum]|uniref:Uncharacterized protein n=1 Tax=Tribolium castaneum TaxID=7070 RepID=A0A139WJ56_TRICA|nr:PREDICTED: uncharacterized protein LOC664136 [Tribolium castaneum]KYB27969.1 hypothetical protein TcasGA2_TC032818 [Tribolium castaneum]|eukprot:XP_976475.2 PREDICTED: uncharacterized protein LOC664136 [Tribolium castaneum]